MCVDRQQNGLKHTMIILTTFEMIWFREVKSTQNHSFKERHLGKFKFTKNEMDA